MISLLGLAFCLTAQASDWKPEYHVRPSVRLGLHVNNPRDLATHRYRLALEQKVQKGEFTLLAGLRGTAEAGFGGNSARYGGTEALVTQSEELLLREFYLQYKNSHVQLRVGNQIVVWGEAYGFFFADIVNPKDLRELAIVELPDARRAVPMLTARMFFGAATLEALIVAQPYFNLSASQGSDFAFPFSRTFNAKVSVNEPRTVVMKPENMEIGGRLSFPLGAVDVSAFYLNYLDRAPSYDLSVVSASPLELRLEAQHPRMSSLGVTASTDLGAVVLKSEFLYHLSQPVDLVSGTGLARASSDQVVAVIGAEKTGEMSRFGLQGSVKQRMKTLSNALTPDTEWLFTLHGMLMTLREQELSWALSYAAHDGSTLAQLGYLVPLSSQVQVSAHLDWLEGGSQSQFGRYRAASRAYLQLAAFLGG